MKTINKLILIIIFTFSLIFLSCSDSVKQNFSEDSKPVEKEIVRGPQKENEWSIMLSEIEEIVDPNNISWPRIVNINDKEIVIYDRPKRITTVSLGHDEILFGISNNDQIVGTTSFAQEEGSNIQDKAKGLPTVSNDPESIIVLDPDIVFADPFTSMELIDALEDFGIKVIVSESFADIFYNNCFKNGILPIIIDENTVKELAEYSAKKENIEIKLPEQKIIYGNKSYKFKLDPFKKKCLLEGLDDIVLSLEKIKNIENFESKMNQNKPWI